MALREDWLTASFLQMSNFCTETQFHLISCLLLEKNDLQKTLKKHCFGSSGCNWTSLLFVSFKCFVTLAFHAFGVISANRQFPPNVKFLHRNSVSLDKLPTFRKK